MSDLDRRQFIAVLGAVTAVRHLPLTGIGTGASSIRVGYAAITWGGKDEQAIDEIAETGYKGIQLRNSAVDTWGAKPDMLAIRYSTIFTFSPSRAAFHQRQPATASSLPVCRWEDCRPVGCNGAIRHLRRSQPTTRSAAAKASVSMPAAAIMPAPGSATCCRLTFKLRPPRF